MKQIQQIAGLVLCAIAMPFCSAQTSSTSASGPSETTLRVTSNLTVVDVVVTDQGKHVRGLDRNRFHIFEDGHEQPITSFDERKPDAAQSLAPKTSSLLVSLPGDTFSNVSAYADGNAVNVLLLDELNTPKRSREFLRQQMLEYVATMQPGASLAIFTLSSDLRMIQGFTRDIAQLTKALKTMQDAKVSPGMADPAKNMESDFPVQRVPTREHDPIPDERPEITLQAMQKLIRYLALIPGHKNLVWFAGTFPTAPALGASFSAANVAVYPVDARGFEVLPASHASFDEPNTDWDGTKANEEFRERLKAEHAPMEDIASQTGGHAYFNSNGLKEALASALGNGSSYYSIGFVPSDKKSSAEFRSVKVRLDGAKYDLSYRHSYYAAPLNHTSGGDQKNVAEVTESVLLGAPPATQILFQARALPAIDPRIQGTLIPEGTAEKTAVDFKAPTQHIVVDLTIDANGLSFRETPYGAHEAQFYLLLAAYDEDGRRVNYASRDLRLHMNEALYRQTDAKGFPTRIALDLPSGQMTMRIAVYDPAARRTGSLAMPLDVVTK
jgi:VWFA-related protein